MPEIIFPRFKRGRILKTEILENLRDFPRDALDCYCENLSSGIVSGLSPIVDKDFITFSKGVIKYNGSLYLVRDLAAIQYGTTDKEVAIKVVFDHAEDKHDYTAQYFEFHVDDNISIADNEIELCRFKLKQGAYLRSNYQDLYDLTTEYNTINVVNVVYAGYRQPTMSHLIFKYFAKEVLSCNPPNNSDVSFAMLCMNSARIERDVVLYYLWNRLALRNLPHSLTNHEIHEHLVQVLAIVKREGMARKRPLSQKPRVLLD